MFPGKTRARPYQTFVQLLRIRPESGYRLYGRVLEAQDARRGSP